MSLPSAAAAIMPRAEFLTEETRKAVLEEAEVITHCLVCYSDLTYPALVPCDHNEICAVCHLRLRHLHKDLACPICKQTNEQVIVDHQQRKDSSPSPLPSNPNPQGESKRFADFPIWGNELGSDFLYREDVGMFFPRDYYQREIETLFRYHCTEPGCSFDVTLSNSGHGVDEDDDDDGGGAAHGTDLGGTSNRHSNSHSHQQSKKGPSNKALPPVRALQDHLRVKHRKALCQLCIDHQRDFVARLPRMTPNQLKQHLIGADRARANTPASPHDGHPACEFCRPTRFYDLTALHQHLAKEHYKCHVCERQGLVNQFFKNYSSLQSHFDRQHFLCHDVQCLTARFVVFENELDLRHHERQVHGGTSTGSSKIQLEFRVRSTPVADNPSAPPSQDDFNYGLDGQAFVPAALPAVAYGSAASLTNVPASVGGATLHPLHVQRTAELRERAAALRTEAVDDVESFPSLAGDDSADASVAAGTQFRVGWSSGDTLRRVRSQPAAGTVTEEEYPSLPATNRSKNHTNNIAGGTHATNPYPALAKLRVGGVAASGTAAVQRPFAAMAASAHTSPTSTLAGTVKATPAHTVSTGTAGISPNPSNNNSKSNQFDLSSDSFPSLPAAKKKTAATGSWNTGAIAKLSTNTKTASRPQHTYTAAEALARNFIVTSNSKAASTTNSSLFPLSGGSQSTGVQREAEVDLSTDNFPSLGLSANRMHRYEAAEALAKSGGARSGSVAAGKSVKQQEATKPRHQAPPSWQDGDFPAPGDRRKSYGTDNSTQ